MIAPFLRRVLVQAALGVLIVFLTIPVRGAGITASAGESVSLSIKVADTAPFTYQWRKNAVAIPGATAASLALQSVTSDDSAQYDVIVSNSIGSTTSAPTTLVVQVPAVAPKIIAQPSGGSLTAGQSTSLSVAATGPGSISYQWRKSGVAIAGALSSTLTLNRVTLADAAVYDVVVANTYGATTSDKAIVVVATPIIAPAIVSHPSTITIHAGQSMSLSVAATGTGPLSYQWQKDGTALAGATANAFQIATADSGDAGDYTVVVTNAAGSVVSTKAVVTVTLPLAITTQPTGQIAAAGGNHALAVAAAGTGLTYQWYRDGRPVLNNASAMSSTLFVTGAGSFDAGIYDCALSSTDGTDVLTRPVVLGIVPATGSRTAGSVTTRPEWQGIRHPNGSVYDQFLLSGAAGTFTAAPGKIARCSYLDENESIVQVEMSGAGAITIVLDNAAGPMAPSLYNQSGITYMKGHATVIVAGANETTHLSIYSVGRSANPGAVRSDVIYDGWAHLKAVGIVTANAKLGGLHLGNVEFSGATGFTGIIAPDLMTLAQMPAVVHDITATDHGQPYLYFAQPAQVRVKAAGGNLLQINGSEIAVSGVTQVLMGAGQDSCGNAAPALACLGTLATDDAAIVTRSIVSNP